MRVCAWASAKNGGVRRRTVISGAALALAGSALAAAPAAVAGPVRICDGQRAVIAKGIGCAAAFWLADHARAGEQIAGWSVRGNSAGVVRLRRGKAWVKLRRVPRASVAALLISGLRVKHVHPPAADGSGGSEVLELCGQGRMEAYAEEHSGLVSPSPGVGLSTSTARLVRGSWTPAYLVEWRGGRTLELEAHPDGGFGATGIVLAGSEPMRLELRDDGSGRLATATGAWPVSWTRDARCRA